MHDVVRIHETSIRAPRKAASSIASRKRTSQGSGNHPRLAAHVERVSGLVLNDPDHARIAAQASNAGDGKRGYICQFAAPVRGRWLQHAFTRSRLARVNRFAEHLLVDVHDDVMPFGPAERDRTLCQKCFRQQHKRIRSPRSVRIDCRIRRAARFT
jgi:hypothetical protein